MTILPPKPSDKKAAIAYIEKLPLYSSKAAFQTVKGQAMGFFGASWMLLGFAYNNRSFDSLWNWIFFVVLIIMIGYSFLSAFRMMNLLDLFVTDETLDSLKKDNPQTE